MAVMRRRCHLLNWARQAHLKRAGQGEAGSSFALCLILFNALTTPSGLVEIMLNCAALTVVYPMPMMTRIECLEDGSLTPLSGGWLSTNIAGVLCARFHANTEYRSEYSHRPHCHAQPRSLCGHLFCCTLLSRCLAPSPPSFSRSPGSLPSTPAPQAPQAPLPERRQEVQPRRSGESSRIVNFFRSIFRRSSQRADASDADSSSAAAAAAAGEGGAIAAAEAAGTAAERFQLVQQMADGGGGGAGGNGRGGGGGGGGVGVGSAHSPAAAAAAAAAMATVDGVDGLASFAIRDFLNFLQPAFVGQDPAGSIASLEQALTWPMGGMVNGMGPGGVMNRRRLSQPNAEEAREELQINGLMLAPHQVSRTVGCRWVVRQNGDGR